VTRAARLYRLARQSRCELDLRDLLILSINRAARDLINSFPRS